jgi:hypothetical protein
VDIDFTWCLGIHFGRREANFILVRFGLSSLYLNLKLSLVSVFLKTALMSLYAKLVKFLTNEPTLSFNLLFPKQVLEEYEGVSKSFRTESITKYMLTFGITRWEATQGVMAAKLTGLTHRITIQLYLVAESCTIRSSRSRRPIRKLLDIPSYTNMGNECFRSPFKLTIQSQETGGECSTNGWDERCVQNFCRKTCIKQTSRKT